MAKKKQKEESYDVIVLGGGDNGLVCAAYLARTGAKTLLLQKQKQWDVAGNLITEEFQGPYHFNLVPPYMIMMGEEAPCYADLDLAHQSLSYITPEVQIAFHHQDGKALVFHLDPEKSAASIARFSAEDADRFRKLYAEFKELSEQILIPSLYVPNGDEGAASKLSDTDLGKRLAEISAQSPVQIIDSYGFESPAVREALLYLATFWGLDPDGPGVGHIVPLWVYRLLRSSLPKAGNLAVGRALYQSFMQHGGAYPGLDHVTKIIVEGGKATGVLLEDGREIRAKAIVSTLNVEETFIDLVGEGKLSEDTLLSATNWDWEIGSLMSCHYGYRGEAPTYKSAAFDPDVNDAYIHIFGIEKAGDVESVYYDVRVGEVPDGHGRAVCMTQHDFFHAGYTHKFGPLQTLRFEVPAPGWLFRGEWESARRAYLDTAKQLWSRYADNVVDGTLSYGGVLTPADFEQRLPTFKRGGFKGGRYTVDRMGMQGTRPAAAGYTTDVDRLYMGGASTHPGGLVYFAAGYNAASVVAKELGLKIWWDEPGFVRSARKAGYLPKR